MLNCTTQRLQIEPFVVQDASFIHRLLNSDGWLQNIGDRGVRNETAARKVIEDVYMPCYQQRGLGYYKISLKTCGTPVGVCGILKKDYLNYPDIGYALLPNYYGQGYITEACGALLYYGFKDIGFDCLTAITLPTNRSSINVLNRLRFQEEVEKVTDPETSEILLQMTLTQSEWQSSNLLYQ